MKVITNDFEFSEGLAHTITSKNVLVCASTGKVVAVFYEKNDLLRATGIKEKVELIDGEIYQFTLINHIYYGIYLKDRKSFFSGPNKVCGESEAHDIIKLTSEVNNGH